MSSRRCSRTACGNPAVATLTYNYGDQTAVVGPLATYAEPHAYDLCARHSDRLSPPRGWQILRLAADPSAQGPSGDDLAALADLVREAGRPPAPTGPRRDPRGPAVPPEGRARHLRVLRPVDD